MFTQWAKGYDHAACAWDARIPHDDEANDCTPGQCPHCGSHLDTWTVAHDHRFGDNPVLCEACWIALPGQSSPWPSH